MSRLDEVLMRGMLYLLAFEGTSVPVNLGLQGRLGDRRPRTGRYRGIRRDGLHGAHRGPTQRLWWSF